ncbi:hypothetical protein tpqmel_0663, partial [Candidatus Gastranaerophilus sp. (ex Termes propinquus)]
QIHNAKELMEEIQNVNSELASRVDNVLDLSAQGSSASKFITRIIERIAPLMPPAGSNEETQEAFVNSIKHHIDIRAREVLQKVVNTQAAKPDDTLVSFVEGKLNELISGVTQEINESLAKQNSASQGDKLANIENNISNLAKLLGADAHTYKYTMEDLESDIAKMRLNTEKSSADIRARLAAIQKEGLAAQSPELTSQLSKMFAAQRARLDNIENMLSSVMQKQNEEFDIKSFIDVFYENTTQAKSLASRVETMEKQLSVISRNMQKIISYIEE